MYRTETKFRKFSDVFSGNIQFQLHSPQNGNHGLHTKAVVEVIRTGGSIEIKVLTARGLRASLAASLGLILVRIKMDRPFLFIVSLYMRKNQR